MESAEQKAIWTSIKKRIVTFVVFVLFIASIPIFLLLYLTVKICRIWWLRKLSRKSSDIQLIKHTSVRTAMDTYRSQGIVTVLLQVKGQCNVQLIKQRIKEDVVEKRNSDGMLRFPHMKMPLKSVWGRYAWVTDTSFFNLDNHIVHVANPMLRNRVITSANIQEYISDAITKYIPPWNRIPPWQLLIVTTEPDKFYILARLHHVYISEDGISFGDLLMIKPDDSWSPHPSNQNIDSIENILSTIYKKPVALPLLYQKVCDFLANTWNEIVSVYDPQENPCLFKRIPNIFQFTLVAIIALVSAVRESSKSKELFARILRREMWKRKVTIQLFLLSMLNSLQPFILIELIAVWCWWFLIKCILHLPISLLHILYDTPVYLRLFILIIRAAGEAFYLFHLTYTSPRVLLEELIWPMFQLPKHYLQKVSLSGRKVVNWTEPIPAQLIKSIHERTGAASCEIQLYGVAAALHEYFQKLNLQEPDTVLTTTRFIPEENLLRSANKISSGLLCLPLPVKMIPEDDPLYGLHLIQIALQEAMSTQTALYLASLWQYDYGILTTVFPSIVARIMLYILSTRYSIMMTQIEAHTKELQKRSLIWGQEIESFFYWRPPQANISLSLSLITYGDELRFAIMADAELSPDYNIIVLEYVARINQLAQEAQNYSLSSTPPNELQTTEL